MCKCVCVCACVRVLTRAHPDLHLAALLRGWRQQDLSKWGQRALALSWVPWPREVGSPVLAPPPLPVALVQVYGTLAALLEQAGVLTSSLPPGSAVYLGCLLLGPLWWPADRDGLSPASQGARASVCPAAHLSSSSRRVPSALCDQNFPAVPALRAAVGCPLFSAGS